MSQNNKLHILPGENFPPFVSAGNQGRSWKYTEVSVEQASSPYSLTFRAVGGTPYADVALDDIDIVDGQCELAGDVCDYERRDLCGFNVTNTTGDFQWKSSRAYELAAFQLNVRGRTLSSYAGESLKDLLHNSFFLHFMSTDWHYHENSPALSIMWNEANRSSSISSKFMANSEKTNFTPHNALRN